MRVVRAAVAWEVRPAQLHQRRPRSTPRQITPVLICARGCPEAASMRGCSQVQPAELRRAGRQRLRRASASAAASAPCLSGHCGCMLPQPSAAADAALSLCFCMLLFASAAVEGCCSELPLLGCALLRSSLPCARAAAEGRPLPHARRRRAAWAPVHPRPHTRANQSCGQPPMQMGQIRGAGG